MFSLFTTAKHVNNTYFSVTVTLLAMQANVLKHRFLPTELRNISWSMLMSLQSYTATEEASLDSFLETYVSVVIETAKLERSLHINADFAIEILSLRQRRIDGGYEMKHVSNNTYVQFYRVLAQYYKENGQEENATLCHAHILTITHDQLDHCYPHCDYFSISIAYENVGDSVHAFQFRELAYKHQWSSLSPMQQAKLSIDLYNDYSNESLGNSTSQADQFSSIITEYIYEYLLRAAESEYIEDIYYDAVAFFRAKNMEEHLMMLQVKMNAIIQSRCDMQNFDGILNCCHHFASSRVLLHSWKMQCHHLTLLWKALHYYNSIGDYSNAQVALKHALQIINEGLKDEYSFNLSEDRFITCRYLIRSGDYFNIFCYGYIEKHILNIIIATIIENLYAVYKMNAQQPPKKQPAAEAVILSTETGVTEKKYSFVWSQFNHYVDKFRCAINIHAYVSKGDINWFHVILLSSIFSFIYNTCTCLSSICCPRAVSCFKFMLITTHICFFIFSLGLDVLY